METETAGPLTGAGPSTGSRCASLLHVAAADGCVQEPGPGFYVVRCRRRLAQQVCSSVTLRSCSNPGFATRQFVMRHRYGYRRSLRAHSSTGPDCSLSGCSHGGHGATCRHPSASPVTSCFVYSRCSSQVSAPYQRTAVQFGTSTTVTI